MASLMIIEDEANIRLFVAANLMARGFQVAEAASAEEGLVKLREVRPELLILDMRLPQMTGWDLLQVMGADPELRALPVIVMTASATNVRFGEPHSANVVHWLVKPVSAVELMQAVETALRLNAR